MLPVVVLFTKRTVCEPFTSFKGPLRVFAMNVFIYAYLFIFLFFFKQKYRIAMSRFKWRIVTSVFCKVWILCAVPTYLKHYRKQGILLLKKKGFGALRKPWELGSCSLQTASIFPEFLLNCISVCMLFI